ncbi:MAG TPA: glutamine--tRNA ligase/YqeY domain fusion protein [Myxococcota bacterium]|nr:glutamine--tRNA ligase/YqeY domain fusion protein [Myxococcota bacterium]
MASEDSVGTDFIRAIVERDVAAGKNGGRVVTRFPPEPNGYLHIGHAKAICLDFGVAAEHDGTCHLRFDDTNPTAEEVEYVDAIRADVRWLGFEWGEHEYYASDYFDQLYAFAVELIRRGKAYVCDLSSEEIAAYRGTLTEPGRNSPYRDRKVAENLDLFERMRAGEFENGVRVLRAKIDMASPNLVMRDPILYRVHKVPHHRTGKTWCVYPMYDFAHCLSDSIESITHSLCTLEFVDHRALYDWILDALEVDCHPQQIEFARGNLSHTVMSKRVLRELVEGGHVRGWDDPRMPTLSGMRRRGYPPDAIRRFWQEIGVAKRDNIIQLARLEHAIREELNRTAQRAMAVIRPLRVVIENYPEERSEELDAVNNPEDASMGSRKVPFARELWIERDDFAVTPPKGFHRLSPGKEVRLRYAYLVTCTGYEQDAEGNVTLVRCRYDLATRGGDAPDGRKVRGTLHWVSARHALPAEVRLYDVLFSVEDPLGEAGDRDFKATLNPDSLTALRECWLEPSLADAEVGARVQFERLGYFCLDPDSRPGAPVWNRAVTLRDTWAKVAAKGAL